ncbi:ABC transporter permease [Liquorilactobacillus satsumensis]|uniref:YhgE/Pip domain-containing protein n=1 Tax=Liquorilactobacillus satsumensis TaxID=259059 RepID=UPI0039EC6FE8
MWKILKSKSFWLYAVVLVVVVGFFSFAQIASRNSIKVKELPVALVNQADKQASKIIVKQLKNKFSSSDSQIKFIQVASYTALNKGFAAKKYYAALVIDKNFDNQLSLQQNYLKGLIIQEKLNKISNQGTAQVPQIKAQRDFAKKALANLPQAGKIKVIINQGMNAQAAQVLTNALPRLVAGLNQGIAKKIQTAIQQNGIAMNSSEWQTLSNPVKVQTKIKNKIPEKSISGMAPMIIVVLAWISSLIGSMLLWREHKKHSEHHKFSLSLINSQILTGGVLTIIASLSIYFFSAIVFGLPIPDVPSFLGLLVFNVFIFYLLQTCVLNWLGFAGWPLIIVIWLLSAGTISYAPEMLSPLFRQWVYNWTPMRFSMEMFTNNLYIHGSVTTMQTNFLVLSLVGLVALLFIYLSSLLKRKED